MANNRQVPPPAGAPRAAHEEPNELRAGIPEATNLGQAIEADMQTARPQMDGGAGDASGLLSPEQLAALNQPSTAEVDKLAAEKLKAMNNAKESGEAKDKHIEVRATRAGYFKGSRKSEGDIFTVPSVEELGTWMEPSDDRVKKAFEKQMAEKAAKAAARREIQQLRARR